VKTIIDLERAAAKHWRGTEEEWLGGWLLRAAEGFTGRANSVLPLGDPPGALDDALSGVTGWYRARGLPAMISVPMPMDGTALLDGELAERGWGLRPGAALVMTADLADRPSAGPAPGGTAPDGSVRVDAEPDDEWLRMHRYRGQSDLPPVRMKLLRSAPSQGFVSIRDGATSVAVGRVSVAEGWAGISAVEVDAMHRRRGLGTAITSACCDEAFARGVRRVFLQVETENEAARALYERCGFTYSHRYHYRLAPGPDSL
jgi:N-acetylglutamate synthase